MRLRAAAAHSEMFGQQIESVDDGVDESVSSPRAGVIGDVGPDLVEVLFGQGGQPIAHLGFLGASDATAGLDAFGESPT